MNSQYQIEYQMPTVKKLIVKVSPLVWNKLMFWCHLPKGLEVSGMGLLSPDSLKGGQIYVNDIALLAQTGSATYTELDDKAMAKFYDEQFDAGKEIGEFGCVWLHTHPGKCCKPSSTDEETFKNVFKRHPWALMLILGQNGDMYGRIKSNFPNIQQEVDIDIDWTAWSKDSHPQSWADEYGTNVKEKVYAVSNVIGFQESTGDDCNWVDYADFSEAKKGLGSKKDYLKSIKEERGLFNSRHKNEKWAIEMVRRRATLLDCMQRGTMYESEVRLLLWYNYWLFTEKWIMQYPKEWALLLEQEGIEIKYTPKGPTMTEVVPEDDFAAGLTSDDPKAHRTSPPYITNEAFAARVARSDLNSDTLPVKVATALFDPPAADGNKKQQGLTTTTDKIMDAMTHGERVESSGQVYYYHDKRLWYPLHTQVMTQAQTEELLAEATRSDVQLELEID